MRITQTRTQRRSARATQPSTPPSNVRTTGPQGTLGGTAHAAPRKRATGPTLKLGTEVYLWILVAIEVMLVGGLRKFFRQVHGG